MKTEFCTFFFCIKKCKYSGDRNFCGYMRRQRPR